MAFGKPLLKTVLDALKKTPADKAEIRQQPVLGVEPLGRGVAIAGPGGGRVTVPVSGQGTPAVGDVVPVVWEKGRPKLALFHKIRRAKAGWDVAGGPVVEELFIATDPATGLKEVWFRNGTLVESLKLRAQLGADPRGVKWGVNKTGFYVLTMDDVYVVFELDRDAESVLEAAPTATELYRVQPLDAETIITTFHLDLTVNGDVEKIQPKRDVHAQINFDSALFFDLIGSEIIATFNASGGPGTLYMDEFTTIEDSGTFPAHRYWGGFNTQETDEFIDTDNREHIPFTGTVTLDLPVKAKDLRIDDVVLDANNHLLVASTLNFTAAIMAGLEAQATPREDYQAYVASEHPGLLSPVWLASLMTMSGAEDFFSWFFGFSPVGGPTLPGMFPPITDPVSNMRMRLYVAERAGWSLDSYGFQSPFYRSSELLQPTISAPVLWDARTGVVVASPFTGEPSLTVVSHASFEWLNFLFGTYTAQVHEHRAPDQPIEWTFEEGEFTSTVTQTEGGGTIDTVQTVEHIPFNYLGAPFGVSLHYTSSGNGVQSVEFLPGLSHLLGPLGLRDEFYHVCPSKFVTRGDITVDDRFFNSPDEGGRIGRGLLGQSTTVQPWWVLPVDTQPPAPPGQPRRATHLLIPVDVVVSDVDDSRFCDPLVFVNPNRLVTTYTFGLVLADTGLQPVRALVNNAAPPDAFFHRTNDHTITLLSASETHVYWADVMFVETDPVKLWIAERLGAGGPDLVAAGQGDAIAPETESDQLVRYLKRRFMLLAPNALYWPDDGEATKVDPKDEGNKFIEWIGADGVTLTVDAGEAPPERDEMSAQGVLADLPEDPAVKPRVYGFEDDDAPSGLQLASVKTLRNPTHQLIVDAASLGGGSIDEP